ncbi:MAG: DUF47 family protein [Arcanobacterium sp.]|nr:DUF47 family protein [Arcanobacterium sp.]MDY5588542.1 DUF47 family protein [Arcanobacterium sp.]
MGHHKIGGPSVTDLIATQAENLTRAAQALTNLVNATPKKREDLNAKLHAIENEADEATHIVLKKINSSFVLPYDREDLFDLTSIIDDCVDMIDEAGDNMVLYGVDELPEKAMKLVDIISECAEATESAMHHLDKITDKMRAFWVGINQLENHGDTVYRSIISDLFNNPDAQPMEVLKMKFVVDCFEQAIDRFENLAAVVETIAIKEN